MNWRTVCILILTVLPSLPVRGETNPPPFDLASLLDRTNREVSTYLDEFSNVTCTERVEQHKLDPKGRINHREENTFDYFVILQGADDDLLLSESRVPTGPPRKVDPKTRLLTSNGFAMLFLIFHPYYRNSFHFEPGEPAQGPYTKIRFSHVSGSRTPAALAVRGREYPLDLSGEAWVDLNTGTISKISAFLSSDMRDIGLRSLRADVQFSPVQLPGLQKPYLYPSTASIEVETLRQRWRNIHSFSNYRRFTVSTQQSTADVGGNK